MFGSCIDPTDIFVMSLLYHLTVLFEKFSNSCQGPDIQYTYITALASATVVFIECMSMAFAYEYDHNL